MVASVEVYPQVMVTLDALIVERKSERLKFEYPVFSVPFEVIYSPETLHSSFV